MTDNTTSAPPQIVIVTDASSIQAQNWGPITSQFSAPTSCTATLTMMQPPYSTLFFGHWWDSYFETPCFPTGTKNVQDLIYGQAYSRWDYYYCECDKLSVKEAVTEVVSVIVSPAICPYGWTLATTFSSHIPGHFDKTVFSKGPETTAALCCPCEPLEPCIYNNMH